MAKAKQAAKERRIQPVDYLASVRPSPKELDDLARVEKSGKAAEFARKLAALDRKYKARPVGGPKGLKKGVFEEDDSRPMRERLGLGLRLPIPEDLGSLLSALSDSGDLACDCVIPFRFKGLEVFGDMTGPEFDQVQRGVIGANREASGEYRVRNPGDTGSTTRVSMSGRIHLRFGASLPAAGRWCLIYPRGPLLIRGHTRVVGHGNMTTSFDSKVSVDRIREIQTETDLISLTISEIHSDATRSEDRSKNFNDDRDLGKSYKFFETGGPTELSLMHALQVHTEANVDGFAQVQIDLFGFLANGTDDFDTFVFKAG